MARPKVPLISRRKALEAALKIMDSEGLEALSIRRLAVELGVNGASLYHHFANKEEIVVGATEIALEKEGSAAEADGDWRAWLPRHDRALRAAVLKHPELVPVVVRHASVGNGPLAMEESAQRLLAEGVPLEAIAPVVDAVSRFAIGSAVLETRGRRRLPRNSVLAKADKARLLSNDELFDVVNTAIIDAVLAATTKGRRGAASKNGSSAKATVTRAAPRANGNGRAKTPAKAAAKRA